MQGAVSSAVSSQPAQDADALDEPEAVSREDRDDVALALALVQSGAHGRAGGGCERGALWHRRHLRSRTARHRHRVAPGCAVRDGTRRCRSSSRRILWSPLPRSPSSPLLPSRLPKRRGRKGSVRRRLLRAARQMRRERLSCYSSPMRRVARLPLHCGGCGPARRGRSTSPSTTCAIRTHATRREYSDRPHLVLRSWSVSSRRHGVA